MITMLIENIVTVANFAISESDLCITVTFLGRAPSTNGLIYAQTALCVTLLTLCKLCLNRGSL